jgi:multiple sugar transport system substrate-binding protein
VYETLAKNGWLTVEELLGPNPWEPTKYQEFPEGKLAICTGGDWQWEFDWGPNGATPIEGLFDKVERWKFPSEEGQPFVFAGMHSGMGVSAKSKDIEGAFEFVAVSNRNDVQCKSFEIYLGGPSGRDDIADACEYYRTAVNGKMVEASSFFATGRYLRPYPGDTKIADGVARATEDVITGKATSEEAMAQFAKAMKDSLGEEYVKEA